MFCSGRKCAAFGAWAVTVMIVSGSGSITGSVVQILRIIKSFSSTLCHRSCITFFAGSCLHFY
ncbi:hypothetical protein ECLT68_2959 [Escherichia coli LT-68]|nr:hypothetical protein ECLT68_2959 [Escherichia coli LT-68]